jgi:sugar transferase (PEP-CTERM/EpsH1 system associated)
MEELLYLIHRIPYPPDKGDKIRSHHVLKHLSQHFKVHVGTFVDDPYDWKYADLLKDCVSGEVKLLPLYPARAKFRSLPGLLNNEPLTLRYYRDLELQNWVKQLLAFHPIQKAVAFSSAMAQYLEPYPKLLRIVDFVDMDSDKWRQYARRKSWPMNYLYHREARTLFDYERHIANQFDASTFVSLAEAESFKQLAPECASRVSHFNNGVDLDYFSPSHTYTNPYPSGERVVVFTGAMDYWANVDAVTWFAREVFPALRAQFSDLRFYIVGSRPTKDVYTLAGDGIVVTGSVADVRPYVAHATLSVAPLRMARGIQNKVLEAMAMAKMVIVTPQAMEGIFAKINQEIILAQDAADFIAHISKQLTQPNDLLGQAARQRVEHSYNWSNSLQAMDLLLRTTP